MNTESSDSKSKRSYDERRQPESGAIVQKSHEVTSNIKQAALERVDSVTQSAHALRDDSSDRVRKLGDAVRKVGEHFRIEDQQYIAERMTSAGKHIGQVADYVESVELGTVVRDARNLARRNPTMFLGGAFLLGLGAGRFLKGTSLLTGAMPTRREEPSTLPRQTQQQEVGASNGTGQERRPSNTGSARRTR